MAAARKIAPTDAASLDADRLWKLERLGAPSLSPDGAQAVVAVTRHDMEANTGSTRLWLLSTLGGEPRALTAGSASESSPRWSPRGDRIAFLGRREGAAGRDETPQLYLIAPDGGEAERAVEIPGGIEAFRWMPDGRRIVFVAWVDPTVKGAAAQARSHAAHKARKETGQATSEAMYRHWDHTLPQGRVPHLHLLDLDSGRWRDLFEGTAYELSRREPGVHSFDLSPDSRRLVFAHDPADRKLADGRFGIVELDLRSGRFDTLAADAEWDFGAPAYSPDGRAVAFCASHQGRKHTMPQQLAVWWRDGARHEVLSAPWDHEVQAPLHWEEDALALLFTAEEHGRQHLWRFDLADRRAEAVVRGGWVSAFDKAAGVLVTLADALDHPSRVTAHLPGEAPRRIEGFNDALLADLPALRHEEFWYEGAAASPDAPRDRVQMWLLYPPGFDGRRKTPLLHVIHGGPHTAMGDSWHWRWNAPLFAHAGYVVALVNYHGSSGFGLAFKDSITHRWGELELDDIERATEALLERPWADPRRVFATGGSYGGYLVAWMNGKLPAGRYAAYVCHAGCFDWRSMFADDAWAWHSRELGGWYWDVPQRVDAQSPVSLAAGFSTPTLVTHGALDYRVPDAQGLAYYNTLKAQGVPARLLWFPDENHWILKPRNSRQWYREFLDWLAAHDRKGGRRRAAPQ